MRIPLFFLFLLTGCVYQSPSPDTLTSIQLLDRNGFSETIAIKERLLLYEKTDFDTPQPYQKVIRIYGKVSSGTTSQITTYHPNGHLRQSLRVTQGRAHGPYKEWHPNGTLKLEAFVIEGTPDVSELAQTTWLFDGTCLVFDDEGHTIASLPYAKGLLHGVSRYYFSSGRLKQETTYHNNQFHGLQLIYWPSGSLQTEECYEEGRLLEAHYLNPEGEQVALIQGGFGKQALFLSTSLSSLLEYQNGKLEGEMRSFHPNGRLSTLYHLKDNMKTGEEWEYYPSSTLQPKLLLEWDQDVLQGTVKTWYDNGTLESQREIQNNQRSGFSFAWFKNGDLMLMEEYEDDLLLQASYFKKGENTAISKIENGKGCATLFDGSGRLVRKVPYEKGLPVGE